MSIAKEAPPTGQAAGPRWYVVRTKPRQEETALRNLERQNFCAYLPRISLKKRRRDRWHQVLEPLFPGYLFLRVNLEVDNVAPVRSTLGVSGMVKFGTQCQPLPDTVVDYFHAREQGGGGPDEVAPLFAPGDRVRVLSGPFAGLEAVYQMSRSEDRAMLLLHVLGGTQRVAMPVDDIGPLSAH